MPNNFRLSILFILSVVFTLQIRKGTQIWILTPERRNREIKIISIIYYYLRIVLNGGLHKLIKIGNNADTIHENRIISIIAVLMLTLGINGPRGEAPSKVPAVPQSRPTPCQRQTRCIPPPFPSHVPAKLFSHPVDRMTHSRASFAAIMSYVPNSRQASADVWASAAVVVPSGQEVHLQAVFEKYVPIGQGKQGARHEEYSFW